MNTNRSVHHVLLPSTASYIFNIVFTACRLLYIQISSSTFLNVILQSMAGSMARLGTKLLGCVKVQKLWTSRLTQLV